MGGAPAPSPQDLGRDADASGPGGLTTRGVVRKRAVEGAPATAPGDADGRARFDIVRIAPDGRAVIAGRAPPDSRVAVTMDKRLLGTARADGSGSWLLLPDQPVHQGPLGLNVRIVGGPADTGAGGPRR